MLRTQAGLLIAIEWNTDKAPRLGKREGRPPKPVCLSATWSAVATTPSRYERRTAAATAVGGARRPQRPMALRQSRRIGCTRRARRLRRSPRRRAAFPPGWSSTRPSPDPYAPYVWQISRTRPTGGSWSNWGSATVVDTYTETQTAYQRNNSNSTAPTFSATASGVPSGWSSSRQTPTSSNRYEWRIRRTRADGRLVVQFGAVSRWSIPTPSDSMRIGCTPRARRLRRSPRQRAASPAAGTRRGGRPLRRHPTSGVSAVRGRRVARGVVGAVPGSSIPTPRRRRPTGGITSARTRRRSAPPLVGCLLAGRRRDRRPRPVIATSGVSAARGRRAARGPIGAVSRWSIPTPSDSMRIGCTPRARRHRRSPRRRAASPAAGTRRGGRPLRRRPTSGVSAVRGRRVARGVVGAVPGWSIPTPSDSMRIGSVLLAALRPRLARLPAGFPPAWQSSRQTPVSAAPYEWRIRRTRSAGGSWSNWGSATVIRTYEPPPETQSAYRISASGSTAPFV